MQKRQHPIQKQPQPRPDRKPGPELTDEQLQQVVGGLVSQLLPPGSKGWLPPDPKPYPTAVE